jgi:hypothetical protein
VTRVLVTGGRDYADRARVWSVLDHYHAERPFSVLIEGEATGLDTIAREWAESRGVPVLAFPADWGDMTAVPCVPRIRRDGVPYNAAAGGIRNRRMKLEGRPDIGLAFPGGKGTADMVAVLGEAPAVPVLRIPA